MARPRAHLGQGSYIRPGVDGDAYEVRTGRLDQLDLAHRRLDITGASGRHRLDGDRRATADLDRADLDRSSRIPLAHVSPSPTGEDHVAWRHSITQGPDQSGPLRVDRWWPPAWFLSAPGIGVGGAGARAPENRSQAVRSFRIETAPTISASAAGR